MTRAAIYTRFSSDKQREASSEDQARNCRRRIETEGWTLAEHFRDEAISGSVTNRPGYQAMLKAAAAGEFDVLIVDDLSRLSRDQVESERAIRRLEFKGMRIIGVSDGYDSTSKSRKVQRGVRGLMNELYLDDLKDKTHRGLTGQALKSYWCGGRPYGYRLVQDRDTARLDAYGNPVVIGTRLVVEDQQAAVVREIFEEFANDRGLRAIASALNARGVPSPGSAWRGRTVRRASGWLGSGIDSMLKNPIYRGEQVWNRSQWVKDPDSGKRVVRDRPREEWIVRTLPELRIVSDSLWRRVEARRRRATVRVGAAIQAGILKATKGRGGRAPRYALSGLLKCEVCGSAMVITGGSGEYRAYQCSGYRNGRACTNGATARLTVAEERISDAIRSDLLTDELLSDLETAVSKALRKQPTKADNGKRIAELREQVLNLSDAVASGAARGSPALLSRLATAEQELERLTAEGTRPKAQVAALPNLIRAKVTKGVQELTQHLRRDPDRARAAVRAITGEIPCAPDATGRYLVARLGLSEEVLRAVGAPERTMVAGVGFEPTTFGL